MVEVTWEPTGSSTLSHNLVRSRLRDSSAERALSSKFTAMKQVDLFRKLREREFNGRFFLVDSSGIESVFYFYLGRIVYATGGLHPVRRWQRSLQLYCPGLLEDLDFFQREGMGLIDLEAPMTWEYQVLSEWVKQQKITRDQITQIIRFNVEEVLFDLTRTDQVSFYRQADRIDGFTPLTVIHAEQLVEDVWKRWQDWQEAKLGDRSPDTAPIIKNFQELEQRTSPSTCQVFKERLNGQYSLRDLSVYLEQDLLALTRSLLIYVQVGLIELISIEDLPVPIPIAPTQPPPSTPEVTPLSIAYGDEDLQRCERMTQIVQAVGHRCLTVQDGLQAISLFVESQPDLICLSSQLLHTDGYTICRALRQLSLFQKTPIWILADNVGLSTRIRAKMAGASEIIEKSASPEFLYQLLTKYF